MISEKQAIESIRAGKHFFPNNADGFIFKSTPNDFDLTPHIFYRQSMMYISFLETINDHSFRELLLAIEDGESLSTVFKSTYSKSLEELWNEFLYEIKEKG